MCQKCCFWLKRSPFVKNFHERGHVCLPLVKQCSLNQDFNMVQIRILGFVLSFHRIVSRSGPGFYLWTRERYRNLQTVLICFIFYVVVNKGIFQYLSFTVHFVKVFMANLAAGKLQGKWFHWSLPKFIDPVFMKTSPKRPFSLIENERFGLVFRKTGSINSGTGMNRYNTAPMP